jgi:hypothetical protein
MVHARAPVPAGVGAGHASRGPGLPGPYGSEIVRVG